MTIKQRMGISEWGMLLGLSILWGGSFFFIEVAVVALPPLVIVCARLVLAAVVLCLGLRLLGYCLPRNIAVWRAFALMGVLNNAVPFSLITWGQVSITSSLASILNATVPLFTVIVAGVFLADERLSMSKVCSVILGFVGVVVLIGPVALSQFGGATYPQLAVLLAAISYSVAIVYGRRFRQMAVPAPVVAAGQLLMSSLFLLPITVYFYAGTIELPELGVVLSVVCLGLFSTALAFILYFRLLSSAGATNASVVTFLSPVTAILLGVWVLGEALTSTQFLGMCLIAAGLLVLDGRILHAYKHTP